MHPLSATNTFYAHETNYSPKLKELRQGDLCQGSPCGRYRGHRSPPAGHRLRYRIWRHARTGHHHCHRGRFDYLAPRRFARTNWRPHGSVHCYYSRHHPAVWDAGPDDSDAPRGRVPYIIRALPSGHHHQVHPLPHRGGFHQRYRADNLHHAGEGPLRLDHRRCRACRLHLQVGLLCAELREHRPVEHDCRCGLSGDHCLLAVHQ